MKFKNKNSGGFTLVEILLTIAIIAVLAPIAIPRVAKAADIVVSGRALVESANSGVVTNGGSLGGPFSNSTVTSTASSPIPVIPGVDIALYITQVAAGSGTAPVTYGFNFEGLTNTAAFRGSGTNFWTTTLPYTATLALNGTTQVTGWFVINHTNLIGVDQIRYDSCSTTQANNILDVVRWKYVTP